jgi:hypothetical protein
VNPDFSDSYNVFLYNAYPQVKEVIEGALSSLSFAPQPGGSDTGKAVKTGG